MPSTPAAALPDSDLDLDVPGSYAYCERLARSHYENFTVGSWFLPAPLRPHVAAIYAFCRGVDDLGDEAGGDRLGLLELWEAELQTCYGTGPRHPVFRALRETIIRYALPREPFLRLIEANRMDQRQTRWPTWADLRHYCRHSADPVGRLFLGLFGYRDEARFALSDATCTALQLTNFWQDVPIDWDKGRVYLPLEDLARFGVTEDDLARRRPTPAFRDLMRFEVERARALFQEGLPLSDRVMGPARTDIRLFSEGGMFILDAIERQGYDVFRRRPSLGRFRKMMLMLRHGLPRLFRPSSRKMPADASRGAA